MDAVTADHTAVWVDLDGGRGRTLLHCSDGVEILPPVDREPGPLRSASTVTGPLPFFAAPGPLGRLRCSGVSTRTRFPPAARHGPDLPLAMAHRGFSRDGLENSMAAFRAAVELGFRHLETDVHTTADGVLLLFHDETLDRVTDGRGPDLGTPGGGGGPGADRRRGAHPAVRGTRRGLPGRPAQPRRQGLEFRGRPRGGDRTVRAARPRADRQLLGPPAAGRAEAAEPPRRGLGRNRLQRPLRPAGPGAAGIRCCASRQGVRSGGSRRCRSRSATAPCPS